MEFISLQEKAAYCPRGDGQGEPIRMNIARILEAQRRLNEVATVNQHTAAELMSTMNMSWLDAARAVSAITSEKAKAQNAMKDARAMAILAATDEVLFAKGHPKPSADLRSALAELDPTYLAARDRLDMITAALHYMQDKKQAFENGYTAVKKLAGQMAPPLQNPNRPERY